jgi:hypothetical protein
MRRLLPHTARKLSACAAEADDPSPHCHDGCMIARFFSLVKGKIFGQAVSQRRENHTICKKCSRNRHMSALFLEFLAAFL